MFRQFRFDKLESSNEKAKEYPFGTVIIVEEQTKGKGRLNREWSSAKGGIYLSIVLKADKPKYLTFIAAISACKAIKSVCGLDTIIKWPNDLIYEKKKVCGILTEIKKDKAIIGIGINTINKIPNSLRNKAISLNKIINKKINNELIINKTLKNFEGYYKILVNKNYKKIISDWKKNSFLESKVKIKTVNKTYEGIAFDVDKDCFLVIKDKKGKKVVVREGDVLIE